MAWGEPVSKKGPKRDWRWRGRYRVGGKAYTLERDDGSPLTFSSQAAAKREAAAKETKMRQPGAVLPGSGRITWGEWCDEWWPKHRETIEANSVKSYATKLKCWVRPRWDPEPLDGIDHDAVQTWITDMDAAASHVHVIYSVFSASMRAAVGKVIPATPCVGIDLPPIEPPDIHFLTQAEFDTLLTFTTGWLRMLALICVGTGMRWGEAVALHWQDVHFEAGTVVVRFAFSMRGGYIKPYPKNEQQRIVPLPDWLAGELAEWRRGQLLVGSCSTPHRVAKRRRVNEDMPVARCRSGLVVPHNMGGCMPYGTCHTAFEVAVRLSQVGHTVFHDLRDTYASWLLQSRRVTIEQVAELLGHADVNLTRRRYARFGSSQFKDVAAALPTPKLGVAPILPQPPQGKIVDLSSRRRSNAV